MATVLADQIIEVAHRFGEPEYARAGGGNASYKADGVLHIKPSGTSLKTLVVADLVPLRVDVLLDALHGEPPIDADPVRAAADAARVGVDDGRRPSVEILLHALLPEPLVLHLHPLTANALACNQRAVELTDEIFGDDAVLVDYIDPGFPLAHGVEQARAAYTARTGANPPALTILRNHGIVAAGNTADEVVDLVETATAKIRAAIDARPAPTPPAAIRIADRSRVEQPVDDAERTRITEMILTAAPLLRGLLGGDQGLAVITSDSSDLVRSETRLGKPMVSDGPLIPDQIVYAGSVPCVVEPKYAPLADQVGKAVASYRAAHGRDPVIVVLPGKVAFAAGRDLAEARNALDTFTDALTVARDANRLGAVRVLDQREREFIETWEAEAYRRSVAATAYRGRMQSKVAVITGAAQGFGLGIAQGLAAEGAHVVLADLNVGLARAEAARIQETFGPGAALAVQVDVSDPASQERALAQILAVYGGLDLFVSNAGIARAASVVEQRIEDFDLVTSVNYKGYFLGVRTVAPVLTAQHQVRPDLLFDIVEINSKSGLEGSKRNFAYAGSKFGGIGLTQSFALELIESGIKVNAVCPGNFLDGPLWSDPEKGLFRQYLRAGKVPGASSVEDVRAFYEAKVPMSRGCLPKDVVAAVLYLVEQQYETGQALTVTGGQIMRN
ncbi:MAG: SDR family NAD(P)-dependent oxidoreductase [Propionibacteriaceae bacterium]|nr:SDR family NAD(P)-dependent oxidoreductase [Propionibacteriaceae bacterium]